MHSKLYDKLSKLEKMLIESYADLDDRYVDPLEPYYDADGTRWISLAGGTNQKASGAIFDESFLRDMRCQCRNHALCNEFAINALENRVNFIIGSGHKYHVVPKSDTDFESSHAIRGVIDEFIGINNWTLRHKEIIRRCDRDGEVFLRLFHDANGRTRIRFVEPEQVSTPTHKQNDQAHSFGIHTAPDDVETVYGYWIENEYVDATNILHRKSNVDFNVKRGISLLFPIRKNLTRVEKLLRNMSIVAEIQSAIALIRKHTGSNGDSIRRHVQSQADATTMDPGTGRQRNIQHFSPGTIIDSFGGTDYQFPIAAIDASRYILILQAELRAIAARLVIPEFMLTSDASNSNYSSTMVAEGPAARMFERLQYEVIAEDMALFRKVVQHAIACNVIPHDSMERVEIHAIPPMLAVRDRLKEARADEILLKNGVISAHTMTMRHGLDPDREAKLMCHCDARNNQ